MVCGHAVHPPLTLTLACSTKRNSVLRVSLIREAQVRPTQRAQWCEVRNSPGIQSRSPNQVLRLSTGLGSRETLGRSQPLEVGTLEFDSCLCYWLSTSQLLKVSSASSKRVTFIQHKYRCTDPKRIFSLYILWNLWFNKVSFAFSSTLPNYRWLLWWAMINITIDRVL